MLALLLKLTSGSFMYHIWEERNHKCFRKELRSEGMILECIRKFICIRLQKKCIRDDNVNRLLCAAWRIS
ncbi:hypothetical protein GQ457_02G010900 [Hibiscus cannabinus]